MKTNWEELYVLSEHWKSDLLFYKDDLRFLHHLIGKYFIWITKAENLAMVKEIKKDLLKLEQTCEDLLAKVGKHIIQIGYLVENPKRQDAGVFALEHQHLEQEITDFIKTFRNNRKEVFTITEYIMDSEAFYTIMAPQEP
tara:strand:- start:2649 stop:3068 length:420 start_codon:yes stop_codon:yes gene_type:complete